MLTGIAALALPATGPLSELSRFIALLAGSGDASPAGLMFLGLGLIGLRDRIERGFRGDACAHRRSGRGRLPRRLRRRPLRRRSPRGAGRWLIS